MANPNAPDAPLTTKRKIMYGALGLALLAALIWGIPTWYYAHQHESTDDAQVDGHIIPVIAKVGGYVLKVAVQDNDSVKSGQLLVMIDSSEYRVKLEQADADLAAARAMAGTRGGVGQAGAAVATAAGQRSSVDAQIDAAKANLTKAQSDLTRAKELVAKQIVSAQQVDAAQAAYDAAAAQVRALEQQAAAANAGVSGAQAGLRMADARVAAAQAARDNAALQLSYTSIFAPEAGTVAKKLVEIGQLVQAGQQLMSIVADTGTWVTANFKETQLSAMRVGQEVDVKIDAYGGLVVHGEVESLSAATGARFALLPPDNATGNFTKVVQRVPVRVRVRDVPAGVSLRPGMSVDLTVDTR
jgi:membrane fusion protein (multidrug efflux system)